MICSSCHQTVRDDAAYCPYCGTPAAGAAAPPEAPARVAPPPPEASPAPEAAPPRPIHPARATGPLDEDTLRARERHERRRARRGPDPEPFDLPGAERIKEMASQAKAAASSALAGASGAVATGERDSGTEVWTSGASGARTDSTLAGHFRSGYAAAGRTAGTGSAVLALSVLLLIGLGGLTATAVDELGYGDIAQIVGYLGGFLTFLVSSMFFLFGLNLRAAAAARRAALDAGVLAAGFDDETRATFALPTG